MSKPYEQTCSICVGAIDDTGIVEVAGELDIANVSMLMKALSDAFESSAGNLILDAQKLTYIDSAGLQTLISIQERLDAEGRILAIVGCHGIFYKLMQITRLAYKFPTYNTVDEALIALNHWDIPLP